MDGIVGVAEFIFVACCATTSTIPKGRISWESAVAEFSLASGFAPTPLSWLEPVASLAAATTARNQHAVSGVALSLLSSRFVELTPDTATGRPSRG